MSLTVSEAQSARAYWLAAYQAAGAEMHWEGRVVKPPPPAQCWAEFQRMDRILDDLNRSVNKPYALADMSSRS